MFIVCFVFYIYCFINFLCCRLFHMFDNTTFHYIDIMCSYHMAYLSIYYIICCHILSYFIVVCIYILNIYMCVISHNMISSDVILYLKVISSHATLFHSLHIISILISSKICIHTFGYISSLTEFLSFKSLDHESMFLASNFSRVGQKKNVFYTTHRAPVLGLIGKIQRGATKLAKAEVRFRPAEIGGQGGVDSGKVSHRIHVWYIYLHLP